MPLEWQFTCLRQVGPIQWSTLKTKVKEVFTKAKIISGRMLPTTLMLKDEKKLSRPHKTRRIRPPSLIALRRTSHSTVV
jgi:hypothetical protein